MSAQVLQLSVLRHTRRLTDLIQQRDWDGVADVFYARSTDHDGPSEDQIIQEWAWLLAGIWRDALSSEQSVDQRLALRAFLRRHRPPQAILDQAWEAALQQGRPDVLHSLQTVLTAPSAAALLRCGRLLTERKTQDIPLATLPVELVWHCLRVLRMAGWALNEPDEGLTAADRALRQDDWPLLSLLQQQGAVAGNWANTQRMARGLLRHPPVQVACKVW